MAYELLDVPVEGGRLQVGRWTGGVDAPVAIAAHGITGNHRSWARVADKVAGRVTFVAPDLRGRGGSAELPGPYGMRSHAEDLLAVADHLGVEQFVAVGHSMGAFVVAALAEHHPDRVRRLVLVDGGLPVAVAPGIDVDAALAAVIGPAVERLRMTFASRDEYHRFWHAHPAFVGRWSDELADYVDYDLVGTEPQLRSGVSADAVRADGADFLVQPDAATALRRTPCPALLLWAPRGMLDQPPGLCPEPLVEQACAEVPKLRAEQVPDVNHYTIVFDDRAASVVADRIVDAG